MFKFLPLTLLVILLSIQETTASSTLEKYLADDKVDANIKLALNQIDKNWCGRVKCQAATPQEYKSPPISRKEARAAMKAGILSGLMRWCHLNWQRRSLLRFANKYQSVVKMNSRQLALMMILHNNQLNLFYKNASTGKACSKKARAALDTKAPKPAW